MHQKHIFRPDTNVIDAQRWFKLTPPYTAADVDKAWKALIKREKIHPDEGGTNEKFIMSENARDILKRSIPKGNTAGQGH